MNNKDRALVKNAANKKQVKNANKEESSQREQQLNDLKFVLETPQGRRVMWGLLEHCKTFNSVWESSAKIHYNSGQQDIGHYLMAEIVEADEKYLYQMMKENKKESLDVQQ